MGDVKSDGQLDMIIANNGNDAVSILKGNGDGAFVPQQQFDVGLSPFSVKAARAIRVPNQSTKVLNLTAL